MTYFASEAYLQTLLFAHASFMLSSIFNVLNTNTVFPLRFLALRSLVTNFQSQKLHTLALVFIIHLVSQKIIGIFKSRNNVLEMEHTLYTRVQVEFFGRENGLKKSTSTYIRENMRHTYRITKKCQNSLQQAKLRS